MDRTEALRSTEGEDPGGHLRQVSKKSPERRDSAFWCKINSFVTRHTAPCVEERRKYNHDFAVSTSFHGLHNLVEKNTTGASGHIRRLLWGVVVFFFVITAFSQVYIRVVNYFSWATTTSVTVQYVDKIEFPSVTFCNLNRYQTNAVNNLGIAFFLWNLVSAVLHFSNSRKPSENVQDMIDFMQINQNFSIKNFTKKYGFYINNSTLLKCDFFGMPCYPEDFEHVFTEYGNCYTFNLYSSKSHKRVSTSGRGLSVLLDIKQAEFTDDPSLGFVDAGITFVIHSPKIPPRFDGLSLYCPAGMHAHASIRHLKTITQEHPWGECNPQLELAYHEVYSTYGCLQECKSAHIKAECGCLPFLLPDRIDKEELCSVGTYSSTCPVPCEETNYPTTLSYSTFPSDNAAEYLSTKLNKDASYMRNNLVYIDIKYQEMNYKTTTQQKAFTSGELLSEVGGQLGLFCGASMITIIEVMEFLLTHFFWLCAFLILKVPIISQRTDSQSRCKWQRQEC
ncbi:hypothetical protein GDO78_011817 [Eleutherodactylus coqui]|uniref:Acid-sensing ion channel 5 n=1 Tax=Eleutherodactylus coqui TaxID=57060 RepID=A0A8J6F165_ELECQ|nr:hypothetical protein GDO78_011817 [Eleutherodactylus coqui]